jgi:hypothetical protein
MASGNSPEKLGRSGVAGGHCMVVRTESLRAPIGTTQGRPAHDQWAKLRLIRDTISHLFACVDRTFVKSNFLAPMRSFFLDACPPANSRLLFQSPRFFKNFATLQDANVISLPRGNLERDQESGDCNRVLDKSPAGAALLGVVWCRL